jgi:hypothetical protein
MENTCHVHFYVITTPYPICYKVMLFGLTSIPEKCCTVAVVYIIYLLELGIYIDQNDR